LPFGVFQVPANSPATTALWGMDDFVSDPIRRVLGCTAKFSVIVRERAKRSRLKNLFPMTSLFFVSLLLLITLPVVILLYVTESRSTRINRLKRSGATWKAIGQRYGVSATTARRWSFA
jgi:hypothetical protein